MKNKLRSSLLVMLVMALVIQLFPMQVLASEDTEEKSKSGYIPMEVETVELTEEELLQANTVEKQAVASSTYETGWSDYESRYYYNLMTPDQKALYDGLYNECMNMLTTQADAEFRQAKMWTGMVEYSGLTNDEMKYVAWLMSISNPQFYFISEMSALKGVLGTRTFVALEVHKDYAAGATRANYTSQFVNKVNGWGETVKAEQGAYNKVRKAQEIVCSNVVREPYDDTGKYQSVATAVFEGRAICVGYAQLFSLLCNAAGVPTIVVTSFNFEWNQVYIDGAWRIVDCSFDDLDDTENTISDNYFLKTDAEVTDPDHIVESWLVPYRPACEYIPVSYVGVYLWQYENGKIEGGAVVNESCDKSALEYRYLVYNVNANMWELASDWSTNYFVQYFPEESGDYLVRCEVRDGKGNEVNTTVGVNYRHVIKETCQIPYEGNQYLIGVQSFDNPNNEYSYEMLILDVNLFTQGLPAWTYTTGALKTQGDTMWTTWAPVPGDYWTLFRVYDKNGNMLDQVCYGFSHR